jgi:hypothetical protein
MAMTPEQKEFFQKGFKVAMNFAFHHHPEEDREKFKGFLLAQTANDGEKQIIEEAINLKNTMEGGENCGPGFCLDASGKCVLCKFRFAFNGKFHS